MRISAIQSYNTYSAVRNKNVNKTTNIKSVNINNSGVRFNGQFEHAFDVVLDSIDKGLYTKKKDRIFYFRYLLECAEKEGTVVDPKILSIIKAEKDMIKMFKRVGNYVSTGYPDELLPVISKGKEHILIVDNDEILFYNPERTFAATMRFFAEDGKLTYEDDIYKVRYHRGTEYIDQLTIYFSDGSAQRKYYDENGEERVFRNILGFVGI